ncbi:MAG: hypothetical protein JOZ54_00645, partial [Acidobacteria bacterium]|nr:hypothetical protein [Acidobacteriota bacterium]MBV9925271.1 hypothetical protein [Acidobacteriota bacterium]
MTTDLISALGMFAAGLVLGGLFLYSFSRRRLIATAPDIARLDLEVKRDALLRQLRELDDSNVEEKQRLELEAAAVLRNLEGAPQAASAPRAETRPATAAVAAQPSATRGFVWGAGSVAAVGLLVWFVANQVKQRGANEGLTGTVPQQQQPATSNQQPANDAALQQLEAAVKASPDDLNLRTDLAKAYLDRENLLSVFEQTRVVLAKDPENA